MREPLPTEEFVYLGPPPAREWRQPELGMRTTGRRAALNVPLGFEYDFRCVSDPYLSGDSRVWVQLMPELVWYQCHFFGRDLRLNAAFAPAHLVWMEWRVGE